MKTLSIFCFLCIAAASTALRGQSFSEPIRVNPGNGDGRQDGPMIQVDRNGTIYVAWSDFQGDRNGDIFMRTSADGGETFTDEVSVFAGGSAPAGSRRGAQFVVAPNGTIHMIWLADAGAQSTDVSYVRSTDGGKTFSQPVSVTGNDEGAPQDYPCIAVDSNGTVYIAFVDTRDERKGTTYYNQIYFTKSTDGGTTFTEPKQISFMPQGIGGSCECCNTGIAVSPAGEVYVVFRGNVDNVRDVYLARSLDGGETFDTSIRAASESWKILACPMAGPTIALDRLGTAHVAWKDKRSSAKGNQYVYYTTLPHGAAACTRDFPISGTATRSNYPSLGITPDGGILCAMEVMGSSSTGASYLYSLDGGNTFLPETPISNASGNVQQGTPIVAIGPNGTRYVVWQDNRLGTSDIWFAKDSAPLLMTLPSPPVLNSPGNDTYPDTFWYFAWNTPEGLGGAQNVSYDLWYQRDGESPVTVQGIQGTTYPVGLTPGTYQWNVRSRTLVGVGTVSETWNFTLAISGVNSGKTLPEGWNLSLTPNTAREVESVTLSVAVPEGKDREVRISLIDPLGKEIRSIREGFLHPGTTAINLETAGLVPGHYYCILEGEGLYLPRPLTIIR